MRAVVVHTAAPLAPLGLRPDACAMGLVTLGEYRRAALARLRIAPAADAALDDDIDGPALVLSDELFASWRALRGFLRATRGAEQPRRLALGPSLGRDMLLPLQDVPMSDDGRAGYAGGYVPRGRRITPRALFNLGPEAWTTLPVRELSIEARIPRYILGRDEAWMRTPLSSSVVMRVRHWVHLLRLSHLMPQIALLDGASRHLLRTGLRLATALPLRGQRRLHRLRRCFVDKGTGCFVHPSAVVEASVLGDNVTVGPHALIIGSVIGAGSTIEDRAHVNASTLGPGTMVSRNSSMSACLTLGDTDACANGIQACVIGPRVGLTSFARPLDLVPGGQVQVKDGSRLRPAGPLPCGVCFGPDVFVGADVRIAPGRAIGAGVRLLADPAHTLRSIDDDARGAHVIVDGRARAISSLDERPAAVSREDD